MWRFPQQFSNWLIIHAALTQPEHLILVRWMRLETQWKTSQKHGLELRNPCLKRFLSRPCFQLVLQINFLNLHIDKATKTRGDKQFYSITHFTKQTLKLKLFTSNVECNGTVLKEPETENTILSLNLYSHPVVATSCFGSLSTLLYTSDLKWHRLTLEILSD